MGHTNSTANLALPQFIGTDKPTWLGDINSAFSDIDAYVGTNDAAVSGAVSDAASAVSQAASAVSTANAANTTAGNASTAATNAVGTANNAMSLVNQTNTKIGTLANLHTVDKTSIVNAINEIADAQSGYEFASYTLGAGETYKDGLDGVYADLVTEAGADDIQVAYLEMPGAVYSCTDPSIKAVDSKYDFTASIPSASQIILNSVELKSGSSHFTRATLDGTVTMRSFDTDSAAGTFKVAFKRFA